MVLWGVNQYIPSGGSVTYLNDTVWQLAKDMGITHFLFWEKNYNEGGGTRTVSRAQYVAAVDRMKDFGLLPIFKLEYNVAEATALVQELGSDCSLYGVCKEPHVAGTECTTDKTTYVNHWNEIVDACREVNPDAMYGGCDVGSYPNTSPTNSPPYMKLWLQQAHDPDFVSVHMYHDPISTKADVIARARTDTLEDILTLKLDMETYGKADLPIMIGEVDWTAAVTTNGWDLDQTFMNGYITALLDAAQELNLYGIFLWTFMGFNNNFCIVKPPSQGYAKKPKYFSVQNYLSVGKKLFTSDAYLQNVYTKTFTSNTWLQATYTKNVSSDAFLITPPEEEPIPKPFTSDAWLQAGFTKTFSSDVWLGLGFTKSFMSDTILQCGEYPTPPVWPHISSVFQDALAQFKKVSTPRQMVVIDE